MESSKLGRYASMRDFDVTPEPSGDAPVQASERPRFVVQKHDATRLHYDFRLEHEGVFLSWAVTRGPSLDPGDKRLAVETEAHPLAYGDFEGVIPAGQYGAGAVMLWDRGFWTPDPAGSVEAGLAKGHLRFTLDGGRMKGGWRLVRLKGDREAKGKAARRSNWLLFKAEDAFADPDHPEALLKQDTSVASGRGMEEIAAGKGKPPKPFMTASAEAEKTSAEPERSAGEADRRLEPPTTPAKHPRRGRRAAVGGVPLPDFIPPQLATAVGQAPSTPGWAHEVKFDGYRLQLHVHDGRATVYSRNGLDWTHRFPEIAAEAARLPDCVVDAEAAALNAGGAPSFPALLAALSEGRTGGIVAYCFDLLWAQGEDLSGLPLRERKARLEDLLEVRAPEGRSGLRYVEHFEAAGEAVLLSACRMDLEGVISKRLDSPYVSGRSESWTKAKCRGGQEVVIGGWTGTGETLRSLLVGVHEGGRLVYAGRVGTGFTRESGAALARRLAPLERQASPFSGPGAPKRTGDMRWAEPALVAEIGFAGWTGAGLVRQGSFKGLRQDKRPEDVVREAGSAAETVDEAAAAPSGAASVHSPARKAANGPAVVREIAISNPDKALWPAHDGEPLVTKADLARYLDAVGERMLPHLQGRPLSLVRTPDGIEGGQRFLQRHPAPGQSALVRPVDLGERKPYLAVDGMEGLIALAQTGATEFHPSNARPGLPEIPGRLVFDLDPAEDVPFVRVVEAALDLRDRLKLLALESFLKTTGGKGLHVVTPLKPKRGSTLSWPEAKAFARELCRQAAADRPDAYVVTAAKRARAGRIFLDYLRNDRLATAVAAFSPRARPGAPVSMPVAWAEATPALSPGRYTLRTVPGLLRGPDPWAGYQEAARPLQDAIKRLDRVAAPGPAARSRARPAA